MGPVVAALLAIPAWAGEGELKYSDQGADTCLPCHLVPEETGIFKNRHGARDDPRRHVCVLASGVHGALRARRGRLAGGA